MNQCGKGKRKCQIQNVGRSILRQSVSQRCQRQGVRERPKAMDQGPVRLPKTNVHLFRNFLPHISNMLSSFPGIGNTEVNEARSTKGCSWGRLMWTSTWMVLLMHLLCPQPALWSHRIRFRCHRVQESAACESNFWTSKVKVVPVCKFWSFVSQNYSGSFWCYL